MGFDFSVLLTNYGLKIQSKPRFGEGYYFNVCYAGFG